MAIVTSLAWLSWMIDIFGWLCSGISRLTPCDEMYVLAKPSCGGSRVMH